MINFGTGGWREIIGDGFTRANVRVIIQALCERMAAEGVADRGVVVGHDRRFLSDEASQWAVEVYLGNGVPVTLIETAEDARTIQPRIQSRMHSANHRYEVRCKNQIHGRAGKLIQLRHRLRRMTMPSNTISL